MSNQTIHELTNLSEISTNDELPIWDNSAGTTKKVSVEELSLAVNNTVNSYSTEEVNTGKKWIDGKPIYRKIVDIGALPNATTKTVAHNISNYDVFTTIKGIAFNNAKTAQIELPYITANNINTAISIEINATDVQIISGINRSSLSGYAILEYTKTTDQARHLMTIREFVEPMIKEILEEDK
jgi:hypothetical protein